VSDVRLRRAYDPTEPEDGTRFLVNYLWSRGRRRSKARVDRCPVL
jgi:uncharacterized protein YeaO (DUF488 family)